MEEKVTTFNYYEKLIFRVHMIIFGLGFVLFGLMYVLNDSLRDMANLLSTVVVALYMSTVVSFVVAIVRIIRYLKYFKGKDGIVGIKRTVTVLLTSPISFFVYFIIMLVMSFALSSCTFSG